MLAAAPIWRRIVRLVQTSGLRAERRDPLGRRGERAAAQLLRRSGYRILGRNVRVPMGEADIVALAPDRLTVVIIEVKSRRIDVTALSRPLNPRPEASVDLRKQAKLVSILRHLAAANNWQNRPQRIDIVAAEFPPRGAPVLRHHIGAVVSERR